MEAHSRSLPRPDGRPDWPPSITLIRGARDRPESPIPARLALARSAAGINSLSTPQEPRKHRRQHPASRWNCDLGPARRKEAGLCQGGVAARLYHMSRTMPKKCSSSSSRGGPVGGGEIRDRPALSPERVPPRTGTEAHPIVWTLLWSLNQRLDLDLLTSLLQPHCPVHPVACAALVLSVPRR